MEDDIFGYDYQQAPIVCPGCYTVCEPPYDIHKEMRKDVTGVTLIFEWCECEWCGTELDDERLQLGEEEDS